MKKSTNLDKLFDRLTEGDDRRFLNVFAGYHSVSAENAAKHGDQRPVSYPASMIRRLFNIAGEKPPEAVSPEASRIAVAPAEVDRVLKRAREKTPGAGS